MGKTINKFVAEPFVNKLGQTINPGDRVAFVTHSHHVYTGKGWFDGVFKNDEGEVVSTRVRGTNDTKYVETGEVKTHTYKHYDYVARAYVERSYEYREKIKVSCEPYGTTTLKRNRVFKIEG